MRKSRIVALFALFAMVAALCPGVALATEGGFQGAPLQSQGDLPSDLSDAGYHIVLDGNDTGWVQYYLDGKDGTVTPKAELYFEDERVDAGLYSLKWQLTWYDETAGRKRYEDATLPMRYVGSNDAPGDYSGIGANYEVCAVPTAGSSLKGESQPATAMPVDKYTFNYHAKYAFVDGGYEDFVVPTWQNGFKVATGEGKGVCVRDDAVNSDNAEIDPQYYSVTYYKRAPGPYDPSSPDYDKVWAQENPLPGFPTEEGTYFAVVEGKAPYFGSTIINFDVIDGYVHVESSIWLDGDAGDLFSDGTVEFKVNAECSTGEEGVDWNVVVAAGIQGTFDDETRTFNPTFDNGEFAYDATARTITLDGAKIIESTGAEDGLPIVVRAWIADKDGNVLCEDRRDIWCRAARADYDREGDRSMLPGWDGEVRNAYGVYVEDSAHPDGAELEYAVTDVEVVGQDAREGNRDVIKLERGANGWRFEALAYGEATLKVTYKDLKGAAQSYEFNVYVSEDAYEVEVCAEGDVRRVRPGDSVELSAKARHYNVDNDNVPLDGVVYGWAIEEGSEFATIAQDASDPAKAIVTFNALADDQDGIWENVKACVRLYDGVGEGGNPNECAYGDMWFNLEQCSPNDHEWSAPTYVWASDMSSVSASRRCANCDLVEFEAATVIVTTTPPTYAAEGKAVYTATFANPAFKAQTRTVSIAKLQKKDQSLKVTATAKTLKAKKLKKKAQTLSLLKVTGAQGGVSYEVARVKGKSKKALKLNASTGKITVKKGTKKGIYSMSVVIVAAGNEQFNVASQTVTVTVKVK